ncbi:MAG TPA: TolC family protein [Arachidicoccus soli]|nr:TolC family protein [Arachidicoccus soli]
MQLLFKKEVLIITCLFTCLCLPSIATAQDNNPYSLRILIKRAEKYLPSIQAKQDLTNAAVANLQYTKHAALPFVKFNTQATLGSANSLRGTYFSMGVVPSTSSSINPIQDYQPALGDLATLYTEYDIYNFGLNKARNENATEAVNLSKADYNKNVYQLKIGVAKLYFDLLSALNLQKINNQNLKRYQTIDTIIRSLANAGVKPEADYFLANAELAKAKIEVNQIDGQVEQAKQVLSSFTGISADSLTINNQRIDSNSLQQNLLTDSIGQSNPILDYDKANNNYLFANKKLIKKSYLPKFTLMGSAWGRASSLNVNQEYTPLNTGLGFQRFNYAVGLAFTYDFMDGLHRKDKLAQSAFEIQAAEESYKQQEIDLRSAVLQANQQIKVVIKNLKQLSIQNKSALEVFNDKQAQYKAGLVTLIDLTNAGFVLYRSQIDYLNAIDDWYTANLNKALATGNLDKFIQSIN